MSSPTNGVEGSYNFCLPNVDDGGCKDPYASNYAADALFDDGTCESTCYPLTIDIQPDCHPEETSWSLAPGGLSIAWAPFPPAVNNGTFAWMPGVALFKSKTIRSMVGRPARGLQLR